jgi:hypothetical protein
LLSPGHGRDDGQRLRVACSAAYRAVLAYAMLLADEDVPSYLETSRRGGHLWLFFAEAVAGQEARAFGRGLLAAHEIEGVELYPKQDQLADGPGSLIRMPFGVHRLTGRRYGFYTSDGSPLAKSIRGQIYALKTPETIPEAAFEAYRSFVPPEPAAAVTGPPEELAGTLSKRIRASVKVLEFVSQYVDLKLFCPNTKWCGVDRIAPRILLTFS